MSTNSKDVGTEPTNTTPMTPEELVALLRAIHQRITVPDQPPAPASLRRRLGHVHPDFINAAINAAGASETVQSGLGRTDEDLRQEIANTARWTAGADEALGLYKTISAVIAVRRQRTGLAALQTYQFCRQLARDERHAARLGAHIAEMRRLNRFGRRRSKPAPPESGEPSKKQ